MNRIGRITGLLVTLSTVVGAAAVALMMLQIVLDVFCRNVFGIALPGTSASVTNYYMVIVAYMPLALAERTNSHITVEVVAQLLNERWRQWLIAFTWALAALVTGVAAYTLLGEAMKAYSFGSFVIEFNRRIPIWPGYFALPIGFGLYSLVLIYKLACAVTGSEADFGDKNAVDGRDLTVGGEV